MLCFYGFEENAGVLEAGVGGVATFGLIAHSSAVGAAGVCFFIVGAGGMPGREKLVSNSRGVKVMLLHIEGKR